MYKTNDFAAPGFYDASGASPPPQAQPNNLVPPFVSAPALERLLTSQQAAQILQIRPKVLERKARRGGIPALKVGKFWRYRVSALEGWIESRLQSNQLTVPHRKGEL